MEVSAETLIWPYHPCWAVAVVVGATSVAILLSTAAVKDIDIYEDIHIGFNEYLWPWKSDIVFQWHVKKSHA